MKRETIRNIIFAIGGAFLLGVGSDISSQVFTAVGFTLIIIAVCLAVANTCDD